MSKIIITFTVDWEGDDFEGIKDLAELRNYIGSEVPATHFICPVYFTKGVSNSKKNIKKNVYDNDEIALHNHNYKSLIDTCNVDFRTEPDFFEPYSKQFQRIINKLPKFLKAKNSGRGIPLSAYNSDEILKILSKSKEILSENLDIEEIISFRAGGWIASDEVFCALEKIGFQNDSSAAPPEILSQGYGKQSIGSMLDDHNSNNKSWTNFIIKMWGYEKQEEYFLKNHLTYNNCPTTAITKLTQPYKINSITEMPNNCGMSDYASARKTMRPVLEHAIKEIKSGRETPFFMNLGCHQEGNYIFKRPVADFFNSITEDEKSYIKFKTLNEAALIASQSIIRNK